MPPPIVRSRFFGSLVLALVPLGLGLRAAEAGWHSPLSGFGPDILWALLIYCLTVVAAPKRPFRITWLVALTLTWSIEISQLVLWEPVVALRATRLGSLLLGNTFVGTDLVCYTVGTCAGLALDAVLHFTALFLAARHAALLPPQKGAPCAPAAHPP